MEHEAAETAYRPRLIHVRWSQTTGLIAAALSEAQAQMRNIVHDATNAFIGNRYPTLAAVLDVVRPALSRNGIAVLQFAESDVERGLIVLTTSLRHRSGEYVESTLEMPVHPVSRRDRRDDRDSAEAPLTAQSYGAAVTYARRYALTSMCGIAGTNEDDDGNEASGLHHEEREPRPEPQRGRADTARAIMAQAASATANGRIGSRWVNDIMIPKFNERGVTIDTLRDHIRSQPNGEERVKPFLAPPEEWPASSKTKILAWLENYPKRHGSDTPAMP